MPNFLIQTFDGEIRMDFCFHLLEALEYNNWYYGEGTYGYVLSDKVIEDEEYIPVGTLEFVFDYLEKMHGVNKDSVRPINIPEELFKQSFLKRNAFIINKNDILSLKNINNPIFVKSQSRYKSFVDIVDNKETILNLPDDTYLISDVIDIESEWRSFIHSGKLIGANHYSGDFKLMPDFKLIDEMIKDYVGCPNSYTLDVGISKSGTFLLEIHPFVSCGLYGFNDYRVLPQMFIDGFNYMLNQQNKRS